MSKLPQPTHYTVYNGGSWMPWESKFEYLIPRQIKFDNGFVFDNLSGWQAKIEENLTNKLRRLATWIAVCEQHGSLSNITLREVWQAMREAADLLEILADKELKK